MASFFRGKRAPKSLPPPTYGVEYLIKHNMQILSFCIIPNLPIEEKNHLPRLMQTELKPIVCRYLGIITFKPSQYSCMPSDTAHSRIIGASCYDRMLTGDCCSYIHT